MCYIEKYSAMCNMCVCITHCAKYGDSVIVMKISKVKRVKLVDQSFQSRLIVKNLIHCNGMYVEVCAATIGMVYVKSTV